jgi:hypothetical protein
MSLLLAMMLAMPLPPQGSGPIVELLGTYPRGEVLCCETTPDGSRAFVADGATLAILDTTTLPAELYPQNVIDWIEMSDVPSNPTSITLVALLDTPGMAQGIELRGAVADRQLCIGDSRSGMRLYGRSGE